MANSQLPDVGTVFGTILKRRRMQANVSQEELAFRAGVDRTYISRLERGIRQPTITTLIGLGVALGIPAAELVSETEQEFLRMHT